MPDWLKSLLEGPAPPMPPGVPSAAVLNNDPGDFSDRYNTPIPSDRQDEFDGWAANQIQTTGKDPRLDRYDYDVNGQWLAAQGTDSRGHGSDQFKKPNHPTFSDQSQYNGVDGFQGGHWNQENGKWASYQPSPTNLQFYGPEELQSYFHQVEPETKLLLPLYRAQPPKQAAPAKKRSYYGGG